jgi:hypothetical protein
MNRSRGAEGRVEVGGIWGIVQWVLIAQSYGWISHPVIYSLLNNKKATKQQTKHKDQPNFFKKNTQKNKKAQVRKISQFHKKATEPLFLTDNLGALAD